MPTVEVWRTTLNITDDAKVRFIDRMETEIPQIFKDLGVDNVIDGGQSMNPSTEDFIKQYDDSQI